MSQYYHHQLKIQVESSTMVLRGSPEESVGCVLRGYVVFHTKENMKIRSITLNLSGKMKVQWSEKNHNYRKEVGVLEHNWNFIPGQKKIHVLSPNTYKYPFEYILPGNLAESMDSNSYGSLLYKLKATVDRPAFLPNLIERLPLRIVRHHTPLYHTPDHTPMQITSEWANKIDYRITVPKRSFSRGEQIPAEFSLMPKPNSDVRVRYLSCFLKEYTSFYTTNSVLHTESRIIRFIRDESFPSVGLHWHKTETILVPHSFDSIQCDTHNQFFKIEHKLKYTMSLINQKGEISELRASLPIEITASLLNADMEEDNELPTYENAWRSVLCPNMIPYLDASSPYSPSAADESYPLTPSGIANASAADYFAYRPSSAQTVINNQQQQQHDSCSSYTMGASIGILPSYHSIQIGINNGSHDDLPSYEL